MKGIIIIVLVVLVVLFLVLYKHYGRMRLHNDVEHLDTVTKHIFQQAKKPVISQNRFIRGLKENLGVNEKMALKLIGQARKENLIKVEHTNDGTQISLADKD